MQISQTYTFDYYPFGMLMPGRSYSSTVYKYGFNGKEKDDEVKGAGNSLDFGARIHDPRLGRFLSLDPLSTKFPSESNYSYAGNSPLLLVDKEGEKKTYYLTIISSTGQKTQLVLVDKSDIRISLFKTMSESFPTVQIKSFEEHIVIDYSKGTITKSGELEIESGTYPMSFSDYAKSQEPWYEGSGGEQNSGWSLVTSGDELSGTKYKGLNSVEYKEINGLIEMVGGFTGDKQSSKKLDIDVMNEVKEVLETFKKGAETSSRANGITDVAGLNEKAEIAVKNSKIKTREDVADGVIFFDKTQGGNFKKDGNGGTKAYCCQNEKPATDSVER